MLMVTGIDLTEEYVGAADTLTTLLGLAERVAFRHASARAMPFAAGTFHAGYMQHVGMNIPDKNALFAEIRRALGATFVIYDVMPTGKGSPSFPLPCATTGTSGITAMWPATSSGKRLPARTVASNQQRSAFASCSGTTLERPSATWWICSIAPS